MGKFKLLHNEGFDVKTEKYSQKEYYYILQISGMLLYTRGKWFWFSLLHFSFFFFMITVVILMLGCAAYRIKDYQLSLAAQSAHILVGFIASLVMLVTLNVNRAAFVSMLTIMEKGYYDYGNIIVYKEVEDWKNEMKKSQTNLATFLPFYFSLVGVSAMAQPLIDSYQGTLLNVSYVNGVFMDLPQPICLPWTVESSLANTLSWFLFEMCECSIILVTICSPILIIIKSTLSITNQLKILLHYINNIEQRALHNCQLKHPAFIRPKSDRKLYGNSIFLKEYELCLIQNVDHFNAIRLAVKHLDLLQRWPMFCAIFVLSVVLACALLTLIKGDTRIAPQLLSSLLLLMELLACATICKGGEEIITLSEEVFSSFYKTKWILCSPVVKKNIIIFQECLKTSLCIKAGGFTKINWELFAGVMNSAYTYFNLVYAMDKK